MANQGESIHACNMCGKQLDEWDIQEKFGFDYYIGYGSKHDMEHAKARFCCDCFDRILDRLIGECKISPIVGELKLESCSPKEAAVDAIKDIIKQFRVNEFNEQMGLKG